MGDVATLEREKEISLTGEREDLSSTGERKETLSVPTELPALVK